MSILHPETAWAPTPSAANLKDDIDRMLDWASKNCGQPRQQSIFLTLNQISFLEHHDIIARSEPTVGWPEGKPYFVGSPNVIIETSR